MITEGLRVAGKRRKNVFECGGELARSALF
jgi:hypothetical protein